MASLYYELETSSDDLLLEDGTGNYLLEPVTGTISGVIKKQQSISAVLDETMAITKMRRGDNIDLVYTISDQSGSIENLTGGSITWKALRSGSTTEKISKTGVLTDPTNGVTTISLDPADTSSLGGTYAVEAKYTDSGSDVYTFDAGAIIIQTDSD